MHTSVEIDTSKIVDWQSFHSVFAAALGFPEFYGANLNAWIDCMTDLDDPEAGMSRIHAPKGGVLVLCMADATDFARRCPEIYTALLECSAFVNFRRMEDGQPPVLATSFQRS